ncbi:beta-glucuronidase [Demequina rhizosphaerae]|uniref:beta-glucuronidase n=1 Tax=Demequina rhizosphaerae TaxID=1638985 RepID=UPI000783C650|nr:beta-glucuronidase [Demequina rhizosphaerae]
MLKPRHTATRELLNLDGMWSFAVAGEDLATPWAGPLDTDLDCPVPASYNDLFTDSAIRDHVGWVWYQRTVRVPRGWDGERIHIRLDAATHEGVVYVDEAEVVRHEGGYLPFEADITDHVTAGQEFRLTIGVNNVLTPDTIPPGLVKELPDGRKQQGYMHDFYNYAGLHRSVWLYSAPATRVTDVTVVTEVEGAAGLVRYAVEATGDAEVRLTLKDESGAVVASGTGAEGTLRIEDVQLWQPGAAYLYALAVELVDGETVVDEYPLHVGVRTVEVKGNQLLINGEPFYFTGFGKHEDIAVKGKGHDDAYLHHDFQLIDWIGANSFRTSHYPYAEEVMDYADRHGIVVIDETSAVGLNSKISGGIADMMAALNGAGGEEGFGPKMAEAHRREIRELIARDKNHPSVVMWSIANEPDTMAEVSEGYFAPLFDYARELDPTRPVTFVNVMMAPPNVCKVSKFADVLCLNRYYGWYMDTGDLATAEVHLEAELRGWEQMYGKPMIMTEYGADTIPGLHSVWDQPWTEEYQADLLDMYHRVFDRVDSMIGEQVWNFADFQTSVGIFRVDGNKKGVFTRDRRPKAVAHSLRKRWTAMRDAD